MITTICAAVVIACTYMYNYVYIELWNLPCQEKALRIHSKTSLYTCKFTVPEAKIVFILFCWVVYTVVLYAAFSVRAGRDDIFNHRLRSYTDCMAGGNRKHHDCHDLRVNLEAETILVVDVISIISNAFMNFASLSFVIQF